MPTTDPTPPEPADDGISVTSWLVIGVIVLFVAVDMVSWLAHWHWASNLWFGYGWPSLKSNGPEAGIQTIVYAAIALVFVPAVRRFAKREFGKVHAKIDRVHQTVAAQHAEGVNERAEIQRHLAHIIKHSPGIPDLPAVGEVAATPAPKKARRATKKAAP